jgi:hypothetical protein
MSFLRPTRGAVTAATVLICASVSSADVLVSNLAEPLRATTDVGNNPNPNPPPSGATEWSWAAQSFQTDAQTYSLTRIDVVAGDIANAPTVVAGLHADNAGTIGALIVTLTVPDLSGPPAPRNLTPSAPVTLAPGTTYWVVFGVDAPGDGGYGLSYANSNDSVGVGLVTAYADSQDSGGAWNYGTDFPYFLQVVVEPLPASCPADLNGDGLVNSADLASLLGAWGPCPG